MSKCYVFFDDSYYENPPCSCCSDLGMLMDCYNSDDTDGRLGSAHSLMDAYVYSIITEIGWDHIPDDYRESLWEMSLKELEQEAANLNIEVIIEGGCDD